MRRRLKFLAYGLVLSGSGAWMFGLFAVLAGSKIPQSVELPLGDIRSIAVDSTGRLYCALGFYSRIQVYDANGGFLRSWHVDSSGGDFRIKITDEDLVQVATARNDMLFTFDPNGKQINALSDSDAFRRLGSSKSATAPDGTVHSIRHSLFWPSVVRIGQADEEVVVASKWYYIPVTGPLPLWFFLVVGVISLVLIDPKIRKRMFPSWKGTT